jgi:hypothetical protein
VIIVTLILAIHHLPASLFSVVSQYICLVYAEQEMKMARTREKNADQSIDIRGTSFEGQLPILTRLTQFTSDHRLIEILTSDPRTLSEAASWMDAECFEIDEITECAGFSTIYLKRKTGPGNEQQKY